ncbi:hypothetical protein BCJMU51_4879 [Bacillus cereus]|uniref:Uncharacterized protein n=1 Tax=Bacillus cereus TaxID=1396 RepID=A0A150AUF3_BACCE|nr:MULTISPECIES: hypothetical protein [Bacillus]OUA67675.1 hypothetical protein BK786_10130 [Bacillus thuringiensis serovar thailandensis]HDR7794050.1 hypothetical protein [Bacillus luti]HDX9541400.1 hypothetical protein [Bacillus thuringiensis]KLA12069.1 hypothetical protein B4087_4540 [Bacillus cereus]KXX85058.1 hypothetical protein AT274_06615 [Bacillus cereus]
MKKKLLIGIVIGIIVATFAFLGYKVSKEANEFTSFREELDKDFFPLLKDTHTYFTTVIEKGESYDLEKWYLLEKGMDDNLKFNKDLKAIRERIVNTDVKYKDTLELKKNVLNSLALIETNLKDINTFYKDSNSNLLWNQLGEEIDKLNKNVQKQNEILGKYYEK